MERVQDTSWGTEENKLLLTNIKLKTIKQPHKRKDPTSRSYDKGASLIDLIVERSQAETQKCRRRSQSIACFLSIIY